MGFLWRRTTKPLDEGIQAVSEYRGAECRVSLSGRITMDSPWLTRPGCQILTADFCEVEYVDTSGLAINSERPDGLTSGPKMFMENCDRMVSSAVQAAKRQENGGYPCYLRGRSNSPACGPLIEVLAIVLFVEILL